MRSVRRVSLRRALLLIGAAATVGLLAGCATTKEKAAQQRASNSRLTVSEQKTRVVSPSGPVKAVSTTMIRSKKRSAFVVRLKNTSAATAGDLPISVGYKIGSRRVYLNARAGLGYFAAHVPPIDAGHQITWVYGSRHRIPAGARPFAWVGSRQSPKGSTFGTVSVEAVGRRAGKSQIHVKVTNLSDIPQYQLEVYAYEHGRHGYVAAGSKGLTLHQPGPNLSVQVPLVGKSTGGHMTVVAIPTLLQ